MLRIAILALALALAAVPAARAQTVYDDADTAEGWAWGEIQKDRTADFDSRCGETGWDDPCRQVSSQFLVNLLTDAKLADRIGQHGIHLRRVRIIGKVNLSDIDVRPEVQLDASRIDGGLTLDDTHWRQPLTLRGSIMEGGLRAVRLRADSSVFIDSNSRVIAKSAGATAVDLSGARIEGDLYMTNSTFIGGVIAWSAKIDGDLQMIGSTFRGGVELAGVRIGGNLWAGRDDQRDKAAAFAGGVDLAGATIGGSVFMALTNFHEATSFLDARIGGVLDLRKALAISLDLTEAEAKGIFLSGLRWRCGEPADAAAGFKLPEWPLGGQRPPEAVCGAAEATKLKMTLRNAHFADVEDGGNAWPPHLDLIGFHYDRLGGSGPKGMRNRTPEQWADWLARDEGASAQPYAQLGAVLAAAGDRDAADQVAFAGRERERRGTDGPRWLWLGFLSGVAGYGIAGYMFRVLFWVGVVTVIGTLVLRFSPNARRHGWFWMAGASLHRLLPVVSLYKEFDNFFDNPEPKDSNPRNLNPVQVAYFAVHAIVGWGLGLILLAAMSGITQKG